jgi:hypothetical protein
LPWQDAAQEADRPAQVCITRYVLGEKKPTRSVPAREMKSTLPLKLALKMCVELEHAFFCRLALMSVNA